MRKSKIDSNRTRTLVVAMIALAAIAVNGYAEKPVKVFILAGQSNMVGQAKNTKNEPLWDNQATAEKTKDFFAHFRKDGEWIKRDDVFIKFRGRYGKLTLGYGAPGKTGSELEFGWLVGDHFDEPVVLIKTAWGGHSLYKHFRPPSAGLPEDVLQAKLKKAQEKVRKNNEKRNQNKPLPTMDDIEEQYGVSYRNMMDEVENVMDNYQEFFPSLKGRQLDIAGFYWFQGFNDMVSGQAAGEYESNMKHFIKDVRKDLGKPELPFVIAAIGTFGWDGTKKPKEGSGMAKVLDAQMAMNEVPEFKGNVRAFETAPLYDKQAAKVYPTWSKQIDEWHKVGSDRPYHYLGSAIWYTRIGHEAGEAMIELL